MELFINDECDGCHRIIEQLPHCTKDIRVWDCKPYVGKKRTYRATDTQTGEVRTFIVPLLPLLVVRDGNGPEKAYIGAKGILEKLGMAKRIFLPRGSV